MELFLVKPNLGNPLILQPKDITEGFELTFAGKEESCPSSWQMLLELRNGVLQLKKIDGSADFGLTIVGRPYRKKVYPHKEGFPVTSQDHQYKTGFRWEYTVKVKSDHAGGHQKWPQMFDLYYYAKRTKSSKTNYHAVYVDTKLPTANNLTLIHVTDLHVARRNDKIPEILSEVRSKSEQRKLYAKYNNFNNNLRAVIKYANEKIKKGEQVILIATGDLVDYYHDGFFAWKNGKAKRSTSNVQKLVDILTGRDGIGEALRCPIFTILGNHDYLLNEPPICWDICYLKEKYIYKDFGLSQREGQEYDFWLRGCPDKVGSHKFGSNTTEIEKRQYIKQHGGEDTLLGPNNSYDIGNPKYDHLACYLEMFNYETDFYVSIGSHDLLFMNTREDVYPSYDDFLNFNERTDRMTEGRIFGAILGIVASLGFLPLGEPLGLAIATAITTSAGAISGELIGGMLGLPDSINDYIHEGPHNQGISNEHIALLLNLLLSPPKRGLIFCFTHSPIINLPHNRKEGIEILFEDNHKKAIDSPNDLTVWLGKYISDSWKINKPCNPFPGEIDLPGLPCYESDSIEKNCINCAYQYFKHEGYPQGGTTYFKEGYRDNFLNYGCADGLIDEFFKIISSASSRGRMRPLNALLSGHTHAVHEFRVQKFEGDDHFKFYIDDYSGSRKKTPQSLPSRSNAQNRKIWLNNHQPLLVTSGALKREDPEFREVVIRGNNIKSMKIKRLPRLGDESNGIEYFYTAMSVELEKLSGKNVTSNKVYHYVSENSRDHAMLRLMDKCHQLLIRFTYSPALRAGLAQEYTNITLWLNSFGVDFGGGPRNTIVPEVHRNWAMTANLKDIYEGIDERIIDIFDFMKPESGGNHLLCAWFTHESMYLAKLGGYDNPYRNSLDPSVHMRWALSVNFAVVINDIREKYRLQFDRLYAKRDKGEFLDFCAESSVRFASWGVEFTSRYKPSMNPDNYRSQYAALISGINEDIEGIWKQMNYHIGRVSSALLTSGSGY